MFVPLSDDNPLVHIERHYVTLTFIAINVVVFVVFQSGLVIPAMEATAYGFGLIPAEFLDIEPATGPPGLHEGGTLVTYMFLHGGWLHLIGNMLFLWVFGDNIEDAMGHARFFFFYLLCGMAAGLTHTFMAPASDIPLVGASGAVAGIVAAYLILHPNVRIWVLALGRIPMRLKAVWVLGAWVVFQFVSVLVPSDLPVAWWAHIGGLAAGAVLIVFMRRSGVPLFDRDVTQRDA